MRQTISGLFAAFAVLFAGAAPAMACGYSTCGSPCGYVNPCAQTYYAPSFYAPSYNYGYGTTGCGTCGTGWGYQTLAEPETQYYYVNQGPTYTGPGAYAPYPTYRETAVTGWAGYERAPGYPSYYGGGYRAPYYGGWHHRYHGYGYGYGYRPHRYAYHYGYRPYSWSGHYRVLRRYY
jgi:hypothetical protein